MNITIQGPGPGRETVSQESLLVDAVNRIGRNRTGWVGVHLHLSKLRPENRRDAHIRIALKMFDSLSSTYRSQIFLLSSQDVVVLTKDARLADIDAIIFKLRALFSEDPLTFGGSDGDVDPFCTWYDLAGDYANFHDLCTQLALLVDQKTQSGQPPQTQALDPKSLAKVLTQLQATNIGPFVRRQPAILIESKDSAKIRFQEFFVSIGDLQRRVAPDVDLTGGRWLFQHLSQTLDSRMLMFIEGLTKDMPPVISLNLNLSTVNSPVFKEFQARIKDRAQLVVEVQILDVFADFNSFFKARDQLRENGHRILLDNVTYLVLEMSEPQLFDADLVKIAWSPALADPIRNQRAAQLKMMISEIGPKKVVLSRCDAENSLRWGLPMGVVMYQGRYLDQMMAQGAPNATSW